MPVECWKKGESKLHHSSFLPDEGMTVRDATNCGKDDEPSSKRATEEIFWLLVMQLPGGGPAAVVRAAVRRKQRRFCLACGSGSGLRPGMAVGGGTSWQ